MLFNYRHQSDGKTTEYIIKVKEQKDRTIILIFSVCIKDEFAFLCHVGCIEKDEECDITMPRRIIESYCNHFFVNNHKKVQSLCNREYEDMQYGFFPISLLIK